MAFKVDGEPEPEPTKPAKESDVEESQAMAKVAPITADVPLLWGKTLSVKLTPVTRQGVKDHPHPADRFENPSVFLGWWEKKAMRIMATEMLLVLFWTITCIMLIIMVGWFQQHDAENFVARLFGKELAKDHELLHKFCLLLGLFAAHNLFSVALLFMLGQGVLERDWRKCGLFVLGKAFLLVIALIFLLCLKVAANSLFVAVTRPNFITFTFFLVMFNYRLVATYVVTKFIKAIRAEEYKMEMKAAEKARCAGFGDRGHCVHYHPRPRGETLVMIPDMLA